MALAERSRRSASGQFNRIQRRGHQRPAGGPTRSNLPALADSTKTPKSSGVKCRKPDSGRAELLITTVSLNVTVSTHSPVWQRLDRCQRILDSYAVNLFIFRFRGSGEHKSLRPSGGNAAETQVHDGRRPGSRVRAFNSRSSCASDTRILARADFMTRVVPELEGPGKGGTACGGWARSGAWPGQGGRE